MSEPLPASAPLVIGATGGSGTRVIARIARHAGYFLGTNLNPPEDAMEFLPLHERWIDRVLASQQNGSSPAVPANFKEDFRDALKRHLSEAPPEVLEPGSRWGWKAPRSIYLLPLIQAEFPAMRFIHVLRDGRDMALSKNQNQLRKHGSRLLSLRERWLEPRPVRSIKLWDRVNLRAAEFCEAELRENYLPVRFEDLCVQPVETTTRILKFLEASGDAAALAQKEIKPPATLGRWRSQPPELIARLEDAAAAALRRFGYLEHAS